MRGNEGQVLQCRGHCPGLTPEPMIYTGHPTDHLVGHYLLSQDPPTGTDRLEGRRPPRPGGYRLNLQGHRPLCLGGYSLNHQGHHHLSLDLLTRNRGVISEEDVTHHDLQITYGVILVMIMVVHMTRSKLGLYFRPLHPHLLLHLNFTQSLHGTHPSVGPSPRHTGNLSPLQPPHPGRDTPQ